MTANEGGESAGCSCWMSLGLMLRHWLIFWLCYVALLNALMSVSMYLSMMPQYTSLHDLAAGHATIRAIVAQLFGYPLVYAVVAVKSQILVNMVSEELVAMKDQLWILEETTRLVLQATGSTEKSKDQVQRVVKIGIALFMVGGLVYGIVLSIGWGVNFGASSGFALGCILMTTLIAYLHLAVMVLCLARGRHQHAHYQVLLHSAQPRGHSMMMDSGYIFVVLALQIVVGLLVILNFISSGWLILSTALGIVFYALTLDYFFPETLNRPLFIAPCTSCFWMAIGTAFALASILGLLPAVLPPYENLLGKVYLHSGSSFNATHVCPGSLHGYGSYPVCQMMQWNTQRRVEGEHLSALDLLVFAEAVYLDHPSDMLMLLGNATAGTELGPVEIEALEDMTEVARVGCYVLPQVQTRIISIRGSSQAADWIFNADVWAPAVLLGLVKRVMPFGSWLRLSLAKRLMVPDIRELLGLMPPWQSVQDRIREAKRRSQKDGYALLLTGHSLGGGLAQLLGSLEGVQSLVFSPVGAQVTLNRVSRDIIRQELPVESTVVSVVPYGDLVPQLEAQEGVVQYIACTSRNVIQCHSILQTACELYRKCGDPRGRNMEQLCQRQVGSDWQQVPWMRFAWYS